jgi:chromosome segregation ATPase
MKGLHKPADKYAEEKAASKQTAKAPAAKSAQAKPSEAGEAAPAEVPIDPHTGKPYEQPDSPEALERNLKQWEESLKRTEELAQNARREMSQVTDPDRWESAKLEAETYEQNIVEIKKRIEETRAQFEQARKQQKKPAPKPSPKAPQPRP